MDKILITGACGQLGSELVVKLREMKGKEVVIASDIREPVAQIADGPFLIVDVMNTEEMLQVIRDNNITQIYHLAAILSAKAESNPKWAWDINMKSLLSLLEICRDEKIEKFYWPSSIAAFGPDSPKENTPQETVMNPNTVYGISKLAGERWCEYFYQQYGVDVRSLRYPGIISYTTPPGGGTTDYAVDIFHFAAKGKPYSCFLNENTRLPMMYIDDAIRATIELMEAPKEDISIRSSYNLAAISFNPKELFESIKAESPGFKISYSPDFRQVIADSWPASIDDKKAIEDWNWKYEFDLQKMVKTMLNGLSIDQ